MSCFSKTMKSWKHEGAKTSEEPKFDSILGAGALVHGFRSLCILQTRTVAKKVMWLRMQQKDQVPRSLFHSGVLYETLQHSKR